MVEDSKILIVILSGVFALIGGFVGALLTRRTEYEKWRRQQQSVAFSEFIKRLNQFRKEALNILYDSSRIEDEKSMSISEHFYELHAQENIVRLYLDRGNREKFSKLQQDIWAAYSPAVMQTERLEILKNSTAEIQAIFEDALNR